MVRSQFQTRLARLRSMLDEVGLDGLLVADLANIRYLTGFNGSFSRLVVGPQDVYLVADRRYLHRELPEPPVYEFVCIQGVGVAEAMVEAIASTGTRRLGFEPGSLSWWEVRALEAALPKRCKLVAAGGQVEELRRIKDELELAAVRAASWATERALSEVMAMASAGTEERELSARLAGSLRRHGDGMPAFEALVASGPRTAILHARPTSRRIEKGDLLLIDAGATAKGMAADLCRTVVVGTRPDPLQARVFEAVRSALEATLDALHPGQSVRAVAATARQVLNRHGYPLLHDIGHGVGLEVHEEPRLAEDAADSSLEPGMVLAIEPGVYIAGWGGIRLEELVLVSSQGAERLSGVSERCA